MSSSPSASAGGASSGKWREGSHDESMAAKDTRIDANPILTSNKDVLYLVDGETFTYIPHSAEEKALLRKVDMRLIPSCMVLVLLNYLDRTNIGNAKTAGMMEDLHMASDDYSLALLIFFVGYLVAEIPSNMLLSRTRPSRYLPAICVAWGIVAGAMAAVHNKGGLVACRFLLGFIESGLFPGILFLLASWYRRHELAKRVAIFYSASITAGAFGGLMAGGITEGMEGIRGIAGWRWLFLIEGILTVVIGVSLVPLMPDFPSNTRWLTSHERGLAAARIAADDAGVTGLVTRYKRLSVKNSLMAAWSDWRTWAFTLLYTLIVGTGTISYFFPTLTTGLGYRGRTAQFMTVPIYAVGAVSSILVSFSADKRKERIYHTFLPLLLAAISYAIVAGVKNYVVRYVFIIVGYSGFISAVPVFLSWVANAVQFPAEKRAVVQANVNMIANLANIYGAYLWPSADGPLYVKGFICSCAFCFTVAMGCAATGYLLKKKPYDFDYARWGSSTISEEEWQAEQQSVKSKTKSHA